MAQPSRFAIQALEDTYLLRIDFAGHRRRPRNTMDQYAFNIRDLTDLSRLMDAWAIARMR